METVMSALSGQVEELRLAVGSEVCYYVPSWPLFVHTQ